MAKTSELKLLQKICQEILMGRRIKNADRDRLRCAFGERFAKAWAAVSGRRVKKYLFSPSTRAVWIVVGKERDYLILPAADFCTCDDFYFRVLDKQVHLCYHLIAQKLAETLERYVTYEEDDELYATLMKEWKKAIV